MIGERLCDPRGVLFVPAQKRAGEGKNRGRLRGHRLHRGRRGVPRLLFRFGEGLANQLGDRGAEKAASKRQRLRRLLLGQGRRGADELERLLGAGVDLESADQKRGVGPLEPAVGVELVEHQKAQEALVLGGKKPQVLAAGEDELEHHVVGKEEVGRVLADLLPRGEHHVRKRPRLEAELALEQPPSFLPLGAGVGGIAGIEGHGEPGAQEPPRQVAELVVGQGVHGVDEDRLGPPPALVAHAKRVVDGRKAEGERLPRPRPRGHDHVLALFGPQEGLDLVDVGADRGAIGVARVPAEDAEGLRV